MQRIGADIAVVGLVSQAPSVVFTAESPPLNSTMAPLDWTIVTPSRRMETQAAVADLQSHIQHTGRPNLAGACC